jgi:hypothetical protein
VSRHLERSRACLTTGTHSLQEAPVRCQYVGANDLRCGGGVSSDESDQASVAVLGDVPRKNRGDLAAIRWVLIKANAVADF